MRPDPRPALNNMQIQEKVEKSGSSSSLPSFTSPKRLISSQKTKNRVTFTTST